MKHNIELTDEQIEMVAAGLSCMAWARDHCSPYRNAEEEASHTKYLKDAKALCESLESLLPTPSSLDDRAMWPDDLE
jgi:hypothetical protein